MRSLEVSPLSEQACYEDVYKNSNPLWKSASEGANDILVDNTRYTCEKSGMISS